MEMCLLCLEVEKVLGSNIKVDSIQWQTENIQFLIEKYLWSINITYNESSGICNSCYKDLIGVHKFYQRIEKVHGDLNNFEDVKGSFSIENVYCNNELQLNSECKAELTEEPLGTEILIEQPVGEESNIESENPLIKVEQEEESFSEEVHAEPKRKRGRPPKDAGNYINFGNNKDQQKKIKKDKTFNNNNKTEVAIDLKSEVEVTQKSKDNKDISIKKERNNLENDNEYQENDGESETDYEDYDGKQKTENCKKKRKNPDGKTQNEHDKIISEYFKIFCGLCQISMENFISLRKHFREEHNKRAFVICCKKKIFTRPILVDHINFHLDPNYFKCKQCEKIYSDRCTLELHLKVHEEGQQERNHTCDTCGKTFVGATQLENHKQTHEPDYEKKFSCTECGKFFTTIYSLNYHIQAIHHNKYVKICDICGKTLRCRNAFKLHMEKHDNKFATPIHCDICGLRLINRRGLKRHKNSQHPVGGKKEYSCQICSKISPNLRALRNHVRFAHETGYIHKCTMCDKAFKRPEALKEHMATHTGTPLYTCPWCPKTFISNGNLHNHRKKAHPKEWEEAQRQKYGGLLPANFKRANEDNTNLKNNLNNTQ